MPDSTMIAEQVGPMLYENFLEREVVIVSSCAAEDDIFCSGPI